MALLVGAIDFGTTYSGWAFSFKTDYERDPTIASVKHWHSGSGTLTTEKTPTCLLVKPDGKTFHAFGYEAENKYQDLADRNQHKDYYYFRRFKMALFKDLGHELNRNLTVEDELGKKLLAIDVFSMSIKYLRDDMMLTVGKQLSGLLETKEIRWVLTVPAIWSDAAKQFMREAATKTGIATDNLTIALEPEAASLYCLHLPVDAAADSGDCTIAKLPKGTKYIVVDAGGGTMDITVHQVHESRTLREVKRASGGNWGGTLVDRAFEDFLITIVGKDVFEEFQRLEMEDWLYMLREFETKKREISPYLEGRVIMNFPNSLADLYQTKTQVKINDTIAASKDVDLMELKRDKLKLSRSLFDTFFKETIQKTTSHMKSLLSEENMKDVNYILMVGGYSESTLLQGAIKETFPDKKVVIPNGASSAVLRGSLMFGHSPLSITDRIVKYTYGIKTRILFKPGIHPESRRKQSDVGDGCIGAFSKLVEEGQSVKLNETQAKKGFFTLLKNQAKISVKVFASAKKDAVYVDDEGCVKVGEINITLEDPDKEPGRWVDVSMMFGGTEIIVEAEDRKTGNKKMTTLDFLG